MGPIIAGILGRIGLGNIGGGILGKNPIIPEALAAGTPDELAGISGYHGQYPNSHGGYGPYKAPPGGDNTAGGSGGGGGYAAPVDPQAALSNSLRGQIQDRIGDLNNVYNQLFGNLDKAEGSQRNTIEKSSQNQFQTLQDQYGQNTRQLPWMHAAMGIGGSSFADNALGDAGKIYGDQNQQIQNQMDSSLSQLGSYVNKYRQQYHGAQDVMNQTDLGGYGNNAYGLQNYLNNLNQNKVSALGDLGSFDSDSAFTQQLNQIAPSKNFGPDQLKQQLATLGQSSLPSFARDQIASGVISRNTQQQPDQGGYWLNYYKNLVTPQGS